MGKDNQGLNTNSLGLWGIIPLEREPNLTPACAGTLPEGFHYQRQQKGRFQTGLLDNTALLGTQGQRYKDPWAEP